MVAFEFELMARVDRDKYQDSSGDEGENCEGVYTSQPMDPSRFAGVALGSLATASASVWGLWAGGKYGGESEGEYGGGEVGGHGRYIRCRLS